MMKLKQVSRRMGVKTDSRRTYETTSDTCVATEREQQQFERLYKESYSMVYNYVRVRMADDHATEDVVAEAYLLAARSFSKFDPTRAKFSTWVTKIAINCMNGYYRKQRSSAPLEDVPETYFAQAGEQDELADRDYCDRLLGSLDATERELIALKYVQGYRNVDIAEALNMNASTVSTMVARALAKMRNLAEELEAQSVPA